MEVCWPAAQQAAAERLYALLHEDKPFHDGSFTKWAKEPSRGFPFHYLDGVSIWLSPVELNPDDDFLNPSASDQALDGEAESSDGGEDSDPA